MHFFFQPHSILRYFEILDFFDFFICGFTKNRPRRNFYGPRNFEIILKIAETHHNLFRIKKAENNSAQISAKPEKCLERRFYQKWPHLVKYRFTPLNTPKSKKFLHFRKVHARSYKKHIYRFFISPIVQKIFAKKEKLKGWDSPLSGVYMYAS